MFGRELLTVLTAGSMYTVSSVRVFAEQSECGSVCVSRASHWVALLNKRLSVGSTPQLRSHPQSLRGLLDTDISFLSMLMLLQLHGVLPISESEVLRFSFEPGPLGLALNAVMFGCLRSPDYLAWTRAFSAVYKRCPFSVPGAVLAADSSCFTHTYVVDDLGRCSDVTKELFQFMGRSTARRNRDIVGLVAADGMHFMRALQQQRYVDVIRVGTEIRGVGPFVMKNITVMLAHSPHASAKDFPWIPELLDPRCKESFVAAGTNGIPFASMLVGQSVEVDSGCDCRAAESQKMCQVFLVVLVRELLRTWMLRSFRCLLATGLWLRIGCVRTLAGEKVGLSSSTPANSCKQFRSPLPAGSPSRGVFEPHVLISSPLWSNSVRQELDVCSCAAGTWASHKPRCESPRAGMQ